MRYTTPIRWDRWRRDRRRSRAVRASGTPTPVSAPQGAATLTAKLDPLATLRDAGVMGVFDCRRGRVLARRVPGPRLHDLPPRWDGLPVQWADWTDAAAMSPERCTYCGGTTAAAINTGHIWTDESSASPATGEARLRDGRRFVGLLTAFRCPQCEHDHVLDSITGKRWDLDDTDYTDEGSWAS